MNILISGGTGLIGRALINDLLIDKHKISVLTLNPQKAIGLLPSNVEVIMWDGISQKGWAHKIHIHVKREKIHRRHVYRRNL